MHELKGALILCTSFNADHIGRIKARWQHPLYPSKHKAVSLQSSAFVQSLSPAYEDASRCLRTMSYHTNRRMQHAPVPLSPTPKLIRLTNKMPTCPVRSGCQASVQILIIEIAGNWKTDAATAPERLFSAAGDAALQAGTADRLKPAGVAYGRRRARRGVEGRFHGVSKGTPNVVRDVRTAQLMTRSVSLCSLVFGSSSLRTAQF